ncbi:heavy metal translocating P-type ATPase [Solitalea lacus]|uniref:heavy metal translocating P-type ATPase n=1 Tax=Solitalea lacus TaxID=2911172 RepID=UPI001EDC1C21|nr:heavy metal translocating P-type ATPase [Solitalea lacus]UKJ08759.1 cadmium-translocating P-type ATPase [Solitalea lacus]
MQFNNKYFHSECETCATVEQVSQSPSTAVEQPETSFIKQYGIEVISFMLLAVGLVLDNYIKPDFFKGAVRLIWYLIAYFPVAWPVIFKGLKLIGKGEMFTEFFLMSIATIGAFAIGEYPEGVAVMLFYAIGELFQAAAVRRAKGNIKALLDVRPNTATVLHNGSENIIRPEGVKVGDLIRLKPGERASVDGILVDGYSSFNTAALTGETKPLTIMATEQVLAGMINIDRVVDVKVTKKYSESSLARILEMVQNASAHKAPTELFIRKFAKIYTPIVVYMALGVIFLPYFFVDTYVFDEWLYRGLIFLVISCPCALVISIPLGYFGGIGAGSRNGILFKGSNYLDQLAKLTTVVMDKTGTLTKGVFNVQEVKAVGVSENDLVNYTAVLEGHSTHPVAKAIVNYAQGKHLNNNSTAENIEEIAGHGLKGVINGKTVLAGNIKLLQKFDIIFPHEINTIVDTVVLVAIDRNYAGYFIIADELKEDALMLVKELYNEGVKDLVMLSGDKSSVVQKVTNMLGIQKGFGDLLPEGKVQKFEEIKCDKSKVVAFVGDGINDAPVLALSDVGIAMGGLGSDAAIETADVVIQTDQPSKIVMAIKIGHATRRIVWQNISLAMGIKVIVLVLGAGGVATMWEAVFADVGVALLAILNAVRIQRMKF